MNKQKTNKTLSKRIKITGTKKLMHMHAYSSHNKTKKSNSRIRRQKEPVAFTGAFEKKLKRLLGI